MKKKKLIAKLSLGKRSVSNLSNIRGGDFPTFQTEDADCDNSRGGGGGGSGITYSNNCSGQTCGNCITNAHPLSDPLHCRTCHTSC